MTRPAAARAVRVRVEGTVQGVGFRPFVFRIARRRHLRGWVRNGPAGVEILAAGGEGAVAAFLHELRASAPPAAVVETIAVEAAADAPVPAEFQILESDRQGPLVTPISPDLATCPQCLAELFDPSDRRHRYPFINCTGCGPRYSIVTGLPYDRPNTTMAGFPLCEACRAEYEDPSDRRHHAQPLACAACGPHLRWIDAAGGAAAERAEALSAAVMAIRGGRIVAVKGLGGFHLVCDARSEAAVATLRARKRREEKPFAVMFPDAAAVAAVCDMDALEESLLGGAASPIVLLRRRDAGGLAAGVAPENPWCGAMLPYTPLHHLLLRELGFPVVATSGNLRDEPICIDEDEAQVRLRGVADAFLVHNRPIARPVDDSIVRVAAGRELILRRARGYAPAPFPLPDGGPPALAVGAHLKNTIAVAVGGRAVLGPHIGDLDNEQTLRAFRAAAADLPRLYGGEPRRTVCDRHPDYLSTREAEARGGEVIRVQHHHAHILAVMAEHGVAGPVLGVAWDGTGWGDDGTIWGGEFLRVNGGRFRRVARLRPFRMPGGDAAAREPRRAAAGALYELEGERWTAGLPAAVFTDEERAVITRMLARGIHAPWTSSAGRLFDVAAAILGLRQRSAFEGQAAMAVEFAADAAAPTPLRSGPAHAGAAAHRSDIWPVAWVDGDLPALDWGPLVRGLCDGVRAGRGAGRLAARFHDTLAAMIVAAAERTGLRRVVLGGGCFQNRRLLEAAVEGLRGAGFEVWWPQRVPPNDGGLALGQLAAACHGDAFALGEEDEDH